jgi:hypothetical protein
MSFDTAERMRTALERTRDIAVPLGRLQRLVREDGLDQPISRMEMERVARKRTDLFLILKPLEPWQVEVFSTCDEEGNEVASDPAEYQGIRVALATLQPSDVAAAFETSFGRLRSSLQTLFRMADDGEEQAALSEAIGQAEAVSRSMEALMKP